MMQYSFYLFHSALYCLVGKYSLQHDVYTSAEYHFWQLNRILLAIINRGIPNERKK